MKEDSHLTEPDPHFAEKVNATVDGMAHWAGTGPAGKFCGECEHYVNLARGRGTSTRCEKYRQMMGFWGTKKLPEVTRACKYFEEHTTKERRSAG